MSEPLCLLMVHAHPDDECLATGGSLARYAEAGVRTVLVIATGGEEGEIVVPELDTPENHARLSAIRDEELACSVAHLGVSDLERLGYRDSGMVGTPANAHPDCFHQADPEEATRRVVALIRRYRPQVLVTYDERGGYGHPDHIACHRATVAAFAAAGDPERFPDAGAPWRPLKLYYTALSREGVRRAWERMRELGVPNPLDNPDFDITMFTVEPSAITTAVDVQAHMERKRRAIACHVTQIRADGPFLAMPDEDARAFFGVEHYVRAASHIAAPAHEDDLFAGLR